MTANRADVKPSASDAPVCEADKCKKASIVGWGPRPMWLCQKHYEDMLEVAGRNISLARTLLGKS